MMKNNPGLVKLARPSTFKEMLSPIALKESEESRKPTGLSIEHRRISEARKLVLVVPAAGSLEESLLPSDAVNSNPEVLSLQAQKITSLQKIEYCMNGFRTRSA